MANDGKEWVSALADDEVRGSELERVLESLRHDPEQLASWGRYHLISDALHANLSGANSHTLRNRVWQALEAEPAILAPRRQTRLPPLAKQAVGFAIAASVAVVAILAVQRVDTPQGEATPAIQMAQGNTRPALAQLASSTAAPVVVESTRNRLNPYLVNHNEYSVTSGMQGVLPYVRIVGNEKR